MRDQTIFDILDEVTENFRGYSEIELVEILVERYGIDPGVALYYVQLWLIITSGFV